MATKIELGQQLIVLLLSSIVWVSYGALARKVGERPWKWSMIGLVLCSIVGSVYYVVFNFLVSGEWYGRIDGVEHLGLVAGVAIHVYMATRVIGLCLLVPMETDVPDKLGIEAGQVAKFHPHYRYLFVFLVCQSAALTMVWIQNTGDNLTTGIVSAVLAAAVYIVWKSLVNVLQVIESAITQRSGTTSP